MDHLEAAIKIEKSILDNPRLNHGGPRDALRREVKQVLLELSGVNAEPNLTLAEALENISQEAPINSRRPISIFLLRLLALDNFFPTHNSENAIERKLITLIEPNLEDFYNRQNIKKTDQTYQKLEKLRRIHSEVCDQLAPLKALNSNTDTSKSDKQSILRALGDKTLKQYCSPYDFLKLHNHIETILDKSIAISMNKDPNFTVRIADLRKDLTEQLDYCEKSRTFFTEDFYMPFLKTISERTENIFKNSAEDFACEIKSSLGQRFTFARKYPLHKIGEKIRILIPMTNIGPGAACNTKVIIENKNKETTDVLMDEISLGQRLKGEFQIPIEIEIYDATKEIVLEVIISWNRIDQEEGVGKTTYLEATIESQSTNIDWDKIQASNPYSLEVAAGEDFYGRKDALDNLCAPIKNNMGSSYIIGQKRVGKTSLARAVENKLRRDSDIEVLFLESGALRSSSAETTVNSICEEIWDFLSTVLPPGFEQKPLEKDGSLVPVTKLLNILKGSKPDARFLVVIDEFDEINHELCTTSDLGDTFFLNIRALSNRPNLGFLLVGAERMAYVMDSHGQKLNKFNRVSLDSFRRRDEWADYVKLVKGKLEESIHWHDSAIESLYENTNGNPYFTKQICSKIFERSVSLKDTDITNEEVASAVLEFVKESDVNAFQHFWADGIAGDRKEQDRVSRKQARVLQAFARVKRKTNPPLETTEANIIDAKSGPLLLPADVAPILNSFLRRTILVQENDTYKAAVPLFEHWLIAQDFKILISDQLKEDMEEAHARKEDAAFVTDAEITDLIENWPTYTGVTITSSQVRQWISQADTNVKKRMLFDLLRGIKFFGTQEVNALFESAHEEHIKPRLPIIPQRSRSDRRDDLWVTYVDGPAKSGAVYARQYVKKAKVSVKCVKEMAFIDKALESNAPLTRAPELIVIIDDFAGTGHSLSGNLGDFYEKHAQSIAKSEIPVLVLVVCATEEGDERVRKRLGKLDEKADLIVCEDLDPKHFAFRPENKIWENQQKTLEAKELCQQLGSKVAKNHPLGYKDNGLLIVFHTNCPNNTLPILHARGKGANKWTPLFERSM